MKLQRVPDEHLPADLQAWYQEVFAQAGGAGKYQAIAYRHAHERERLEKTLDTLRALPLHGSILEIGCNEGYMTRELAEMFEKVYAIDFNPAALATCPELPNVTYELYDATQDEITFVANVVLMAHVLEHVLDPQAMIAQYIRYCSYLVAVCPTSEPLNAERAFQVDLIGNEKHIGDASGHVWAMDAEGFLSLFDGYEIVERVDVAHATIAVVRGAV